MNVLVGDVAEDAARQHDACRDGTRETAGARRISGDDLDRRRDLGGAFTGAPGQFGVELDQARANVGLTRVLGQHAEEVAPIAGAHADHPDRTRR